ncbi:3-oxoacyl-[acyl-carrier-protein] synthase 3 protein 1 [Oxobacter pfennigii]|uniref:Beta-ketoacyl-[acyl-carrier-protein] synthase III n=1 Tax=Oxobacter pfennigii TaxID=36849 RepID=A0A0P8WN40_9CLOT|nr:beta-ketoacyl-ACP synthase III [Oxobacter pfennigii]KPU43948.1 3-oxoacyl-[acyl-carrier-protein] synthase 3 protein 1 [Oxobacter pfennigii]
MSFNKIYARISGTGSGLPEKVLTNADLEKMVDTSDEWITSRTGIKERRIARNDEAASDIGTIAAKNALADAGLKPEEVDLIIVSTVTPDMIFPSTACIIQKNIEALNAAAFDIEAACTGFIYGITVAAQFIENGFYKNVLVVGVDVLSKITNWQDRNTCVLFGDGAGAVVLTASDKPGIMSGFLGSDGNGGKSLCCLAGGSRMPATEDTISKGLHYIAMEGSEVFKFAVKTLPEAVISALNKCNLTVEDIDWLIPHQANTRIIESAAKKLGIPMEKTMVTLDKYGNNSSATIPIAIDEYARLKRIKDGDILALVGFGGGLTWGASIIKWQK